MVKVRVVLKGETSDNDLQKIVRLAAVPRVGDSFVIEPPSSDGLVKKVVWFEDMWPTIEIDYPEEKLISWRDSFLEDGWDEDFDGEGMALPDEF